MAEPSSPSPTTPSPTPSSPTTSSALTLRPATHADIVGLNALIARSAEILGRGYYTPEENASAIRFVFGVDTSLVDDGTYLVAELDGALAGCGGWSARRTLYGGDQRPVHADDGGGGADRLDPATEPAKIRAFFVAPEAARRGVGRAIFERCASEADAAGFASLELMATLPGVPFYAALGFVALEDVADRLPDGVVVRFVRMRRAIGPISG